MRNPLKRMKPSAYSTSRHALVSRRTALRYGLASGAGLVLVACGNDESILRDVAIDIDSDATPSVTGSNVAPTSSASTADATSPLAPVEPATSPTSDTGVATTLPLVLQAIPDGSDLIVGFTYEQGAGGKNTAPYTAVWVEDVDGMLVHTITLWRRQGQKGLKYLPDLTRWFNVDQTRVATEGGSAADVISGPTRFPGQYTVAWDGRLDSGEPIAPGEYFVCIESAREDGPHSLIRELVALTGAPISQPLPDDAELVAASASIA